ncbi:hypothetical protein D3C77_645090 [compost metagenome]
MLAVQASWPNFVIREILGTHLAAEIIECVRVGLQEALRPVILNQHDVRQPFRRPGVQPRVQLLNDIRLREFYDVDFGVGILLAVRFLRNVQRGNVKRRVPGPNGNLLRLAPGIAAAAIASACRRLFAASAG